MKITGNIKWIWIILIIYSCSTPKVIKTNHYIFGRAAITLYPFIIYNSKAGYLDHEMIHWKQIQKYGPGHFYMYYILDYLQLTIRHPFRENYYYIKFEKEAYAN